MSAGPPSSPSLRASDADRDRVIELLRAAVGSPSWRSEGTRVTTRHRPCASAWWAGCGTAESAPGGWAAPVTLSGRPAAGRMQSGPSGHAARGNDTSPRLILVTSRCDN
jgi:hypothetical protein